MPCLGLSSLFRSSKQSDEYQYRPSTASQRPYTDQPASAFQIEARRIAQIPVGNMSRNPNSTYLPTHYQAAHGRAPYTASLHAGNFRRDSVSTNSTNDTLIGSTRDLENKASSYSPEFGGKPWQASPHGPPSRDPRTELTEEDEEMWARMAM